MLTESEVQRTFAELFKQPKIDSDVLDRAEELIDELRFESPLRHRLATELDEIRKMHQLT